ncbi:MAG: siderophore-interacting protein, partial [Pseudomonadota bacterium]
MGMSEAKKLVSKTSFSIPSAEDFIAFWVKELEEHEFEYTRPEENRVEVATPYGNSSLVVDGTLAAIEVAASSFENLINMREGVTLHLEEIDPAFEKIAWSGANDPGSLLPNLRLVNVHSVQRLGDLYWRIGITGDDIKHFAKKGLHFRLVRQQNHERDPVWPTLSERGTPAWPKGEDELIDRVYTTRFFDEEKSLLSFDVFIHDGGFTSDWAGSEPIGERVAIMGPGGGWYPDAQRLIIAGDETALPAIARILENAGPNVT